MPESTEDGYTSWLLLELGQEGRPVEQVAQFMASWFVSGGMEPDDCIEECSRIAMRVVDLMYNQEKIWSHLLPGGSQGDPLEHPDTTRLHKLVEIIGKDPDMDLMEVFHHLNEFLENEGLITEQPGSRDDSNMYASFTIVTDELENATGDVVADEAGNLWHWWTRSTGFRLVDGHDAVGATVEIHADDLKKLDGSEVHAMLN